MYKDIWWNHFDCIDDDVDNSDSNEDVDSDNDDDVDDVDDAGLLELWTAG